jgi:hypothetical protein
MPRVALGGVELGDGSGHFLHSGVVSRESTARTFSVHVGETGSGPASADALSFGTEGTDTGVVGCAFKGPASFGFLGGFAFGSIGTSRRAEVGEITANGGNFGSIGDAVLFGAL